MGFEDGSERSIPREELWLPTDELPKTVQSRMVMLLQFPVKLTSVLAGQDDIMCDTFT